MVEGYLPGTRENEANNQEKGVGVGKQRQEMKRKESECVHGGM